MFFGVLEASHLLHEQGSELGAVRIVDRHVRAPLGDMVARLGSHATGHAGHEPRVAVLGVIFRDLFGGVEAIVSVAQSVLEVVA